MNMREVLPKASWYLKEMNACQARISPEAVRTQEHTYRTWWAKKWGKQWQDREEIAVKHELPRTCILKPDRLMGTKDGLPVTLRCVPASSRVDNGSQAQGEFKVRKGAADALFVIIWKNKRVDAFLNATRAKAFLETFLQEPPND